MKLLAAFVFSLFVTCAAMDANDRDPRFSATLTPEERAETGLNGLSSDEVASLDALVRRDIAARGSTTNDAAPASTFSQRLTADERRVTGVASLAETEVARLNGLVDRHTSARLARALLAPPAFLSRTRRIEPAETKDERKIRGSFTLAYSWGSGGYSARTGAMELHFDDPKGRYSISIGYAETHAKYEDDYRGDYVRDVRDDDFERPAPIRP